MTQSVVRSGLPVRPQRRGVRKRQNLAGWLFVGPVIFGILLFQIAPVIASLGVSFTNWTGLRTPKFIALDNYVRLFTKDDQFYRSLLNTGDLHRGLRRRRRSPSVSGSPFCATRRSTA